MTSGRWRRWALWASLALTLILFVVFRGIENQLQAAGVVALELAFTPARAAQIVQGWPAAGRSMARTALWLDFIFIVAYAGGLALLFRLLADHPALARWSSWLRRLAWAPLLAGALDVIENSALFGVIAQIPPAGPPPPALALLTMGAGLCASLKFGLVGLTLLIVAAAGGAVLRAHARRAP